MTKKMLPLMLLTILAGSLGAMEEYEPILCKNKHVVENLQYAPSYIKKVHHDKESSKFWLTVYSWFSSIGSTTVTCASFFGLVSYTALKKKKPSIRALKIATVTTTLGGLFLVLNKAIQKRINKQKKECETDYQSNIKRSCFILKNMIGTKESQEKSCKKYSLRDYGTGLRDIHVLSKIKNELNLLQQKTNNLENFFKKSTTLEEFPKFKIVISSLNNFIKRNRNLVEKAEENKIQPLHLKIISSTDSESIDSFDGEYTYRDIQSYF